MVDQLFVVGAFSEGMFHFNKLSNFVIEVEEARAHGSVYLTKVGFPVYTCDGHHLIDGQVLTIEGSESLWRVIDELYGVHPSDTAKGLHERVKTRVECRGQIIEASVYSANPKKLTGARLIDGGNWRETIVQCQPLPLRLTDSQKTYVCRLGQSSGREIVPIDLALYRELMNLELIVDKGRRLALSSLGKEVYQLLRN